MNLSPSKAKRPSAALSLILPRLFLTLSFSSAVAYAQQIILTTPGPMPRLPEVVEVPLSQFPKHAPHLRHMGAEDATTHKPLSTQLWSSHGDTNPDTLLIAVQMPPSGQLTIQIVETNSTLQPRVFGREAPERKDDFAWENELVTYRVYGPALEATGEIASGIDVWSKRVPNFIIDSFYARDAEGQRTHNPALSYHKDNGIGLDAYLVGPTRGCGGTGVLRDGKLWVSKNYTHLRQLASGPIRFEFELAYAPFDAAGISITETKRIRLDAGSRLNQIDARFDFTGSASIEAAAGLALHPGADNTSTGDTLSVWDTPQEQSAGHIPTGLYLSPGTAATTLKLEPNLLAIAKLNPGQHLRYYAGSGWSKADMPTPAHWNAYLARSLQQLTQPLRITWQDSPGHPAKSKH